MEKPLVPRVFALTQKEDQGEKWLDGRRSSKALSSNGTLHTEVTVEICPLAQGLYHCGPYSENVLWCDGAEEIQYAPRRIFFDHLGYILMDAKMRLYSHSVLSALYSVAKKFPKATTLTIIFPRETVFQESDHHSVVHTIQKSFVDGYQTPGSKFRGHVVGKISSIEEVYLVFPGTQQNIGSFNQMSIAIEEAIVTT